jgi:hypothetical protein
MTGYYRAPPLLNLATEMGLGLCHRFGLNYGHSRHPGLSDSVWLDYRKAWRTLMFLSK